MSEAMKTAVETALTTIKTDTQGMFTTAIPIALSIAGIGIAIRLGMGFFRSLAK